MGTVCQLKDIEGTGKEPGIDHIESWGKNNRKKQCCQALFCMTNYSKGEEKRSRGKKLHQSHSRTPLEICLSGYILGK